MPKETRKRSQSATAAASATAPSAPPPVDLGGGYSVRPTPTTDDDDDGIVKLPPIPIVKATGKIAYDRMHGATKDKVDAMLAANGGTAAASGVPLDFVYEALRSLNGAITLTVAAVTKAPRDIVIECTTFGPQHLERLGPPSQAMLAKYAPKMMDRWSVEMAFGMAFFNVVQEMISDVRARADAQKPNTIEPDKAA